MEIAAAMYVLLHLASVGNQTASAAREKLIHVVLAAESMAVHVLQQMLLQRALKKIRLFTKKETSCSK